MEDENAGKGGWTILALGALGVYIMIMTMVSVNADAAREKRNAEMERPSWQRVPANPPPSQCPQCNERGCPGYVELYKFREPSWYMDDQQLKTWMRGVCRTCGLRAETVGDTKTCVQGHVEIGQK